MLLKLTVLALDALDTLFALEVTASGRQTALATGGDLTARLAYAHIRSAGADAALLAAKSLEQGRARSTGEALRRQEAQLAIAEHLLPDLLESFREASNRLTAYAFRKANQSASSSNIEAFRDEFLTTETTVETSEKLEHRTMRVLHDHLLNYEEAQKARASYDAAVTRIREKIPDFLAQEDVLASAVGLLTSDERLVYMANTPTGAVAVLIGNSTEGSSHLASTSLWDELLTSSLIMNLLDNSSHEGEGTNEKEGLLDAQHNVGSLQKTLLNVMETLGTPDGVLAQLAAYCHAEEVRRLIIIPCGLLGLLPLHAALVPSAGSDKNVEPLFERVQVSYATIFAVF